MKHHCRIIGTDCTNSGVTSSHEWALLCDSLADFSPTTTIPQLILVVEKEHIKHARKGKLLVHSATCEIHRVQAIPIINGEVSTGWSMFGGHWLESSDSRFPYDSPIPVFDRFE